MINAVKALGRPRHGSPEQSPQFWREHSARPYFDRINEHRSCPPRWGSATQRALRRAGVDSQLQWYDDGTRSVRAFNAAMDRTVRFVDREPGRG